MWLEEVEELFKGYLPYYILVFLPIFIIVSPASPVSATHEFPVYRMQHFDLHGVAYGSRAALVNLEGRAVSTWSSSRHCVVVRILDLTLDQFRNIRSKAGALVVVMPPDITKLTAEQRQQIVQLEYKMLHEQEIPIPVYFTPWSPSMDGIVDELATNIDSDDKKKSATEALFSSVLANGYQISISASTPAVKSDMKVATIHGHLAGYRADGKVPTIAIVAHYDSFGAAPELSFGADSNASGVVILLELMRLLSGLYADPKTRGKYNVLFILSGGGKINFQGSKKWLEDQLDAADGSLIQDTTYVMCLDTLATSETIFMHVSKPPKEGTASSQFFKNLKSAAEDSSPVTVEGVHKKINLADDILAWEHERFSIRRLPAFTLSSIKSHKDGWKSTMLDTSETVNMEKLQKNTKVIVDAMGKYVYNISNGGIFSGSWDVNKDFLRAWMKILSSQPRSPQILSTKDNSLLQSLQDVFNKYLSDVKVTYSVPDKRDPDYQFFGVTSSTMNVYSVKPAVFDLVLTVFIMLYLGLVYFFVIYFPKLYHFTAKVTTSHKKKTKTK